MQKLGNQEIASIFFRIADMLEMQGVEWKPRAYRAAASAIESLGKPVSLIYEEGGAKALEDIPGVGEAIAEKIGELVKTGQLRYFNELKKSVPVDFDGLETVPGLGPKKIALLYKNLGVKDLATLKAAAEQHRIAGLPGFAEKSEQDILKAVRSGGKTGPRILLSEAKPVAEKIVGALRGASGAEKIEVAGSFRRKRPTIGDLDILVASEKPGPVAQAFVSMPLVKTVLASGRTKSSVVLKSGLQVDLRVVKPGQWGSALQYFTGSKAHSIALRKIAIKKGLKLSEYGVFRGGRVIASRTEKDVYNALGMDYIKPELRENEGEIEAAMNSFNRKKK